MRAVRAYRRWSVAVVAAAYLASGARAQTPGDTSAPGPTPRVEIYYGIKRVTDAPPRVPGQQPKAAAGETSPESSVPVRSVFQPIFVPVSPSVGWRVDGPPHAGVAQTGWAAESSSPVVGLIETILNRLSPGRSAPRALPGSVTNGADAAERIVVIREAAVDTKSPAQPPQPTMIVVREPAAESRTSDQSFWVYAATMLAGMAGAGAMCALTALYLRSRPAAPPVVVQPAPEVAAPPAPVVVAAPPAPPAPAPENTVVLMGQYNAGTLPESAEKFELGPTYREEQVQKVQKEADTKGAVLANILEQNLGLFGGADTPDEPSVAPTTSVALTASAAPVVLTAPPAPAVSTPSIAPTARELPAGGPVRPPAGLLIMNPAALRAEPAVLFPAVSV
ncbi:hypothetical protein [Fimbriiglobus ruber]|uniref:Uncharacterized protein n=1 Tax=Fimbriiglobus ruber TaxID=1908690 RepID=A0A225DZG9_9BACT|nr:hypothetical protein [Fimbriiglobus ruber]OWK44964.1 hypothetical protein FRUB_01295 [Fimbriiglobus ruber]